MSRRGDVGDALTCAICLNLLDDHRVLECGHSYCLKCLQRCIASKARQLRGALACPKCKRVTNLPPEGVPFLKINYDLVAIIDAILESTEGCDDDIYQDRRSSVPRGCTSGGGYHDNQIGQAQMNVQASTESFQQYIKDNKDLVKLIKESAKKVEYDINEHFKGLVAILEDSRQCAIQEVEAIRNARIIEVDEDRANAERTLKSFKECREHLKKVEKMKPTEEEYVAQLNSVCSEADAVTNNRPPDIDTNLAWMEYVQVMTPGNIQCAGRLRTDRTIQLELENEFGKGWLFKLGKARGIAVNPRTDVLAVAESSAHRVSVWQNVKGEYHRKFYLKTPWYIQAMQKPTDVAVTADGKFVVIDSANTIKIFSPSGEYDENELAKEEGTTCATSDVRLRRGTLVLMDSGETIAR